MNRMYEEVEIFIAIVLTLLAKFLMTETPLSDEATELQKKQNRKRAYGGIIAGGICAYYGHTPLIEYFDVLTVEADIPVTIALAISGEHIFRALITKLPDWIQMFVENRIKK